MRINRTGHTGVKETPAGHYVPTYRGISYGTYETAEEAAKIYKQKKESKS